MDSLYGQPCPDCGGFHNAAVKQQVSFSEEALTKGLREIYSGLDVRNIVEKFIFEETLRQFNSATAKGIVESGHGSELTDEFLHQLRTNNAVFAAFRTHRMQNDVAKQLIDENGKLKSFDKWMHDINGMTNHYVKNWLQSEYSTAVIRAHQAADWKHFEDEKDVFPNLRWMPTTSPNQDPLHRQYWEHKLTLPINHPFWDEHRPGDRWNCKCTLVQTDDPVNDEVIKDFYPVPKQPGLDNNPGKDAKLFSDTHPYVTQAYPGAKKAIESVVSPKRKQRTQEESERIREAWKERKEIIRIAEEWAKPIPFEAIRKDAESAARIMMNAFGKDYSLPRISIVKEKGSRGRILHHHASYSDAADLLKINTGNKDFIQDYIEYKRKAVEMGWSSQRNTILHELSHQLHSKFDKDFQMHIHQGIGLDKKYVEKYLSQYGATDRGEYEAELISGILSGKKYPDRILAQARFASADLNGKYGKVLLEKGRDISLAGVEARRTENKALAKDLTDWFKANLPENKVGLLPAKRFVVENMYGETIVINKNFYNEVINKYQDDLFYSDKLETAKKAHKLIKEAKFIRTEQPNHTKHNGEIFKVYEKEWNGVVYEFKIKVTDDEEQYLYYLKRK